jgi:hypothetical protein
MYSKPFLHFWGISWSPLLFFSFFQSRLFEAPWGAAAVHLSAGRKHRLLSLSLEDVGTSDDLVHFWWRGTDDLRRHQALYMLI